MKILKNQSWYEITERGKIINSYPIQSEAEASVAINICKREKKDINTSILIARDRLNFFK